MAHYMSNGYDWLWMIPMMFLWVIVIGAVVYAAVRIGSHDALRDRPTP